MTQQPDPRRQAKRNKLVALLIRLTPGGGGWGEVWDELGLQRETCKCGRPIWWTTTLAGKQMPVNDEGKAHFADCPFASDFRKRD